MANNPYVNKVEYAGNTIMDITDTTAEPENVLSGEVFYSASGQRSVGSLDISGKADKVSGATAGDVATLDANGNLVDSGKTLGKSVPSDAVFTDTTYSNATQSAAGLMSAEDKTKLDGVATGATANVGTITGITMNGASKGTSGVVDLGTVITSHQDISGKSDKVSGATAGDVATLDANGNLVDSGKTLGKSVPSDAVFTDTTYAFDGTYNSSTNKAATVSTVTNAINALDGNLNSTTPGAGKTLTAFSETNGIVSATFGNISITKSQVSDFPTSMTPASHTHGNIQNGGALQTTDITIANGDKLVVTDSSDSSKVARTSIAFDGSTTSKALTQKGTWGTFLTAHQDISGKKNTQTAVSDPSASGTSATFIATLSQNTQGVISLTKKTVRTATAATASAAGTTGLVPAAPAGSQNGKFLSGDATFKMVFPNYKTREIVGSLSAANNTYTAPANGFLIVHCVKNNDATDAYYNLTIDGQRVLRYGAYGSSQVYLPFIIPMEKGTVIKVESVTNMWGLTKTSGSDAPVFFVKG